MTKSIRDSMQGIMRQLLKITKKDRIIQKIDKQ